MSDRRLVPIGKVRRAHGLAGEVRVETYNPDSELLLEVDEVMLAEVGEPARRVGLRSVRPTPDAFLVAFEGIGDRSAAEKLRGAEVLVLRDALPPTDGGEFYHVDLIDLVVIGPDDAPVGRVRGVQPGPAHDTLVLETPAGEWLVPVAESAIARIDLDAGRIVLQPWEDPEPPWGPPLPAKAGR